MSLFHVLLKSGEIDGAAITVYDSGGNNKCRNILIKSRLCTDMHPKVSYACSKSKTLHSIQLC